MEPINFYNNGPSIKQHKAVVRWFYISTISCGITVIVLACLHVQQHYLNTSLISEKNELHAALHTLNHVAQYQHNQKLLQSKLEKKANHLKNHSVKNPLELLKSIKASLNAGVHLEALSFNEKNLELKITSENIKTLTQCAQHLSKKSPNYELHITSFESKENNRIIATIKN